MWRSRWKCWVCRELALHASPKEGASLGGRPFGLQHTGIRLDGWTNAPWLADAIQTQQDKLVGLGIHLPLPAIMDVRAQVRPSASEDPSDVPALRPAEWSHRHCCGYLSALVICASSSVSAPTATYPAHSTSLTVLTFLTPLKPHCAFCSCRCTGAHQSARQLGQREFQLRASLSASERLF